MKKLLILMTFLGVGVLNSCSKDTATTSGEALTVTSDAATHYEGESFKFTVTSSADGSDVSSQATITVDDKPAVGNTFYSLTKGTFTVKAMYSGTSSKSIQVTVTENPTPLTAVTVTPSATNVVAGDVVTFTAAGDNGSNLSQACVYYVNGKAITGNTFTATETGTLDVYAVYPATAAVTSETVHFVVNEAINFTKRVLIEDYTGAWCGWCPRIAYAIGLVNAQTNYAVPVAIHYGYGTQQPDPFTFSEVNTLGNAFKVTSFPTGKLNRKTTWITDETKNVKQVVDLTTGANPRVGLAMTTSMASGTATINLKVKFGQNFSGLKLVVYALEDKLIGDQHNYTTLPPFVDANNKPIAVIKGFEYNDVLRTSLTNVLGDDITGTNYNEEFAKTFTYAVPTGVNADNVHFVAFVVDSTGKALNVRNASNNDTQDYEIQ